MSKIRLINEDGVIKGIDPETGDEVPVEFDDLAAQSVSTDRINNVVHVEPADGQANLQSLLDEYGGQPLKAVLSPGVMDGINDNIVLPPNTWLQGSGMWGGTRLKFADGAGLDTAGMIRVTGDNVTVSNMELVGNRANVTNNGQEYGVFSKATTGLRFHRLKIRDFPGYGFDPYSVGNSETQKNLVISDSVAVNNGNDGITVAGSERAIVSRCHTYNNDRHGVNITDNEGNRIEIHGVHSYNNAGYGISIQNSVGNTSIVGGHYNRNGGGGIRFGSDGGEVCGCVVTGATFESNGGYGMQIRGSSEISVIGCSLRNNAQSSENAEISIQDTSNAPSVNVVIMGNQIAANGTYGVDERTGNGPTTVLGNSFSGAHSTAVSLDNASSHDTANIR